MWARLVRNRSMVGMGLLVAALGITWILRSWQLADAQQDVTARQRAAVESAVEYVRAEFADLQSEMLETISSVATDPTVTETLYLTDESPNPVLLQFLENLDLPQRTNVDCYTPQMALVAWRGVEIPPSAPVLQAPTDVRWTIAHDEGWRDALAVWHPVSHQGEHVGAIRLSRSLYERVPVQNESLRNYALVDDWTRQVGLPIEISYAENAQSDYELTSMDGLPLASLTITPPTAAGLMEAASAPYENLAALWLLLLIVWVIIVLWRWNGQRATVVRVLGLTAATAAGRYLMMWVDIPARYQTGKAPLSPLFDPTHLASTLGGGLMRSSGDFLLTVLCLLFVAVVFAGFTIRRHPAFEEKGGNRLQWAMRMCIAVTLVIGSICILAAAVHASVFDSTLDYVTRNDLMPVPLELVVFCAVAVASLGVLLLAAGLLRLANASLPLSYTWYAGIPIGIAAVCIFFADLQQWCPWFVSLAYLIAAGQLGRQLPAERSLDWLSVRQVLLAVLVVSLLVYPLFYQGISERKKEQIAYAAASFETGDEPGISFAVREVVEEALRRSELPAMLDARTGLDSIAFELLQGSLLSSLTSYDAGVAFIDTSGELLHVAGASAAVTDSASIRALFTQMEPAQRLYESTYAFLEPLMPGTGRHHYAGLGNIDVPARGWILVQARPHIGLEEANTPLLRILLSSGYRHQYTGLSLASFNDGFLVRSVGRRFERYRLDEETSDALATAPEQWRRESIKGRTYDTFYSRANGNVVAARMRVVGLIDHLYYLLRLMSGGLIVGIVVLIIGLVWRWRTGKLPAARVRFRDRVLNAFILVGVLAVIPVGIAGVGVITEENEKAVQSWLRQHLQRVEETLESEARPGESSLSVLGRISIEDLTARSGLDLNLFRDARLVAASRPQLITDRIIDKRLPASAFRALYIDSDRFTFEEHILGDFKYTAGYRAILDDSGQPRYVLSVPSLPEAERIEEERARTLAYLFGALLALGMIVLVIASVLARALSQPIARLQRGLQEVAEGRFEQMLPVQTRDEVGDLVRTFNTMQGQLTDSRQKLAQQERQLAWREMARQVAHEIKNPLTPMKLSVQHLQRAGRASDRFEMRFRRLFERVTKTLVNQIDSLAQIANEFATLARLPSPDVTRLDLASVIREAHALMMEEAPDQVQFDLDLPVESCFVRADRNALRRIFINVIKNALEALQNVEAGTITIALIQKDNLVTATVSDTGPGVPKSLQSRIFEPSFSTKTSGAGLGLAIARQSAETMGGSMDFESQTGRGTSMHVHLPLAVG